MENGVLIATGIATAISAAGTLALAIVAVVQGRQMSAQLAVSKRQAASGETSAKAALDVNKESVRSRVDQTAPRVVAFYEQPKGPLVDVNRSSMPQANELRLLDPLSFDRSSDAIGQSLVFPDMKDAFIWYHGVGVVVNEGSTTAYVRLADESKFVSGKSPLDGSEVPMPYVAGDGLAAEAILAPGRSALFKWAAGHAAKQWATAIERPEPLSPYSEIWHTIVAFDSQRSSIADTLEAVYTPSPLEKSPGKRGSWDLRAEDSMSRVYVQPVTRVYASEEEVLEKRSHQQERYQEFMEAEKLEQNNNLDFTGW